MTQKRALLRLWEQARAHPWISVGLVLVIALVLYRLTGLVRSALAPDETWMRIQREGVLRVGMDASYPPFEFVTAEGLFQGYDVDLARALGERWQVNVQFVNVHFDGLYDALAAGRCDLIISALPYDRTMTRDLAYSQSYFNAGQIMLLAPSATVPETSNAFVGRVAVELGSEGHLVARRLERDTNTQVEIVAFRESEQVRAAVEDGQAEAAIVDRVTAMGWLADDRGLQVMPEGLTSDPYVIAVPAEASELLAQVDKALDAWRDSGFLGQIEQIWLGASQASLPMPGGYMRNFDAAWWPCYYREL